MNSTEVSRRSCVIPAETENPERDVDRGREDELEREEDERDVAADVAPVLLSRCCVLCRASAMYQGTSTITRAETSTSARNA
ncbi:hypothetical protein [Brachybacterium sp. AOP3-A1-3]|uniref:hypothetical protein n=1 Tax=Brachybacterium sp. AOP3-A1-3 TaxID=3457699 RepID=UPI0040334AB6